MASIDLKSKLLFLIANIVTTSKAPVTTSKALVTVDVIHGPGFCTLHTSCTRRWEAHDFTSR